MNWIKRIKLAALAVMGFVATPVMAFAGSMPHFSIREVVWDVVCIIGVGIIFGLLDYLLQAAPLINATFKQIGRYLLIVVAVLIVIYIILGLLGL